MYIFHALLFVSVSWAGQAAGLCAAAKLTDYDCSHGSDCDEASCVLGMNNQHPSEVMGTRREGPVSEVQPVWGGGVGWGQWDTASWNPTFGEAPCLMGGREVNSTAPKLYLIFIHMNAPGRDRLLQTN